MPFQRGSQLAEQVRVRFLKQSAVKKPFIREIIVRGSLGDWWKRSIQNPNHQVKEVNSPQKIMTDLLLVNGTVILTNYRPTNEMAVQIRHRDYYDFMTFMFESLWANL